MSRQSSTKIGRHGRTGAIARLLLALALLVACAWPAPAHAAERRPDLLFVLADDMDMAAVPYLPQLQRLVAEGTTLASTYVTVPLCSPSRATLLTGNYAQNTEIRRNLPPHGGLETFFARGEEASTVAVWLRNAGYRTGLIGKYLNQHTEGGPPALHVPPGWDRWVTAAEYRLTHVYYGFALNEDGRRVAYPRSGGRYLLDVYDEKARAFVADALKRPQPFALFLWLPVPHEPVVPAPRYAGLYPDVRLPRGPSLPERDVSDKPPFLRFAPSTPAELLAADEAHRQRLRMLRSLDATMGALLDQMRAAGRLDDAYVVFMSDNGWHHAYHNLPAGKGTAFEEDARVPLVVRGPGIPAGRIVRRLVGNADIAPTLAEWAGAARPEVDGRSLARLLTAADPDALPWRRRLPLYRLPEPAAGPATSWPSHGRPSGPMSAGYGCMAGLPPWQPGSGPRLDPFEMPELRGLRDPRFTFVQYTSGDLELYDDRADPSQLRNAVCGPARARLPDLRRQAAALTTCRGAACRAAEDR